MEPGVTQQLQIYSFQKVRLVLGRTEVKPHTHAHTQEVIYCITKTCLIKRQEEELLKTLTKMDLKNSSLLHINDKYTIFTPNIVS